MRVELSGGTAQTHYFHKDHLGSISVITNEVGTVIERLGYDAWAAGSGSVAVIGRTSTRPYRWSKR